MAREVEKVDRMKLDVTYNWWYDGFYRHQHFYNDNDYQKSFKKIK